MVLAPLGLRWGTIPKGEIPMPSRHRHRPLERPTLEAYAGIICGILGAIVTAWWAKLLLLAIAAGLLIHASFKSHLTIKWPLWRKLIASAIVLPLWSS
jgi:hypothetical protein